MFEDPLLGQQIGNFRIERLLGSGGMAQVYYGWDVALERPVALKVIDARYRSSPAYAARFVREARAVATWRHENIVQIYYADEQEGIYYFVMEYIEGLDLRELIGQYVAEGELMPHDDVIRLGRAIASALDYAHQKGVIHRDVKPSNVMVTGQGRVVLTDFGLAMDIYRGTLGEAFGSPYYIAPEQARSSAAAVPQSDLYSLGVILYELLTGVVPFDDPSSTVVAIQHIMQPPPPPCQINPDLGAETEAVLLKALSKSPDERYPLGAALLAALEAALQASPVEAVPMELPPLPPGVEPPAPRSMSRVSVGDRVTSRLRASAHSVPDRRAPEAARDASLIGQQLDDFYLEAMLGQGGMARIYRGLEAPLNRRVAIKVIDTPFRANPDYLVRFEREAQAIAKLEHPHIVRLYRYGKDKELLYMAMQYIDGADLDAVLASYREAEEFIEPCHAQRIIREVCEALDYAHSQGIIHRDVKPANIMIDRQDHAILTDFGLALLTEAGTRGMIFGSPYYISPEQAISSANVVPQSDLYALGVILYEMFTGQVPFSAKDPLDVAMLHMSETPRPPRELRPDLSPAIEAVILKALAKESEDRYATGQDLADALEQALSAVPSRTADTASQRSLYERATRERTTQPRPDRPAPQPGAAARISATPPPLAGAVSPPAAQRVAPEDRLKGARVILYAGIGLIACLFLTALLAGVLYLGPRVAQKDAETVGLTATPKATATETPVAVGAETSIPEMTPLLTSIPTSSATVPTPETPVGGRTVTSTPEATPSPTATPAPSSSVPADYDLWLIRRGDESLLVVNQASESFPLAALRLDNDKGKINGVDWDIGILEGGACVVAWKERGKAQPPEEEECMLVADLPVDPPVFWEQPVHVYFEGERIDTCAVLECHISAATGAIELPADYDLLVAKHKRDGFFVVNGATEAFPLTVLRLGNDKGSVHGTDWGVEMLEPGDCVVVWKDESTPKRPKDLECNQVGTPQIRDKPQRFWEETFNISCGRENIYVCEKNQSSCTIQP